MEKIYVCQFEQQNMVGEEFDPGDYCSSDYPCQFKRQIGDKTVCMKPPEAEVVLVTTLACDSYTVMTVADAAEVAVQALAQDGPEKVDIRAQTWTACVDTSWAGMGVSSYARGQVPEVVRVVLRSAF